jgi:hypothetical protein
MKNGTGMAHNKHKRKEKNPYRVLVKKPQEKGLSRRVKVSLSQPHRQTETEEAWFNN